MSTKNTKKVEDLGDFGDNLQFARDCMLAYQHLGKVMGKRNGTSAARELHAWASNPENTKDFLTRLVPTATSILQKADKDNEPGELVEKEKRSIAELKTLLENALKE